MEVRKAFYLKNPISSEMGVGQVNLPTEGKDFRKYEELLFEKAQEIWSICILTRTDQYGDELSSDNIEIYAVLKSRNRTEFCPIALVWPKLAINKTNENANALLVSKAHSRSCSIFSDIFCYGLSRAISKIARILLCTR